MRVNVAPLKATRISTLPVGTVFIAERKSVKGEGVYMKIDSFSGLVNRTRGVGVAVNLASGQLREFPLEFAKFRVVDPVLTIE